MSDGIRNTMFVIEKLRRDIGEANFSTFKPIEDCSSFQGRFQERLKRYRPDLINEAATWRDVTNAILKAAEEKNIEISARSLSGWAPVKNGTKQRDPSTSSSSEETRILAYKICAAMGLDISQIYDFFTSVFLTKAFFVRRIRELLYYYFLISAEENWYTKAEAVFAQCSKDVCKTDEEEIAFTLNIFSEIEEIKDESGLLEFIDANKASLQSKYIGLTARVKIVKLLQKIWPFLCIERQLIERTGDDTAWGEFRNEELLNKVLGLHTSDGDMPGMSNVPASVLPRQISQTFPNAAYLSMIVGNGNVYWRMNDPDEKYKSVQPDIIRKMLLLLNLYNRFAPQEIAYALTEVYPRFSAAKLSALIDDCYASGLDLGETYDKLSENDKKLFEKKVSSYIYKSQGRIKEAILGIKNFKQDTGVSENRFTEFVQQTNSLLDEAGFPGLYVRNAYDYLIVYCAAKKRPISALRELINSFLATGE